MRTVKIPAQAVVKLTDGWPRGSYSTSAASIITPEGKVSEDGRLVPGGYVYVENGYSETILHMLPSGTMVQIKGD